ncbi:MAG: hypothetical protein RMM17_11320 [Acidobacteriota bacterium]|nr:hypothetical protein [Blastocatellia bacterium]MDW8413261.1 hypothetical protein [Acidobacteriota bacterium]
MTRTRLKLTSANLETSAAGNRIASVQLELEQRVYLGTASVPLNGEEPELEAISGATLEAVKKALPVAINTQVKKVLKLRPEFLDDLLLVAIVELHVEHKKLSLTGCCVCHEKDKLPGMARATLDSTNRVVEFFLSKRRGIRQ